MNNRYIFRGKRKDNGEWIEGYYVCNGEHCYIFSGKLGIINKNFNWERYEVIPETVGQCTGLKDKNGKLIFEGDIVEYMDAYSTFEGEYTEFMNEGTVLYEDGSYFITNRSSVEMSDIVYKGELDGNIIGNIHDNPELLEAEI